MSDQRLTQRVNATVPTEMINGVRAKWPEAADLTPVQVVRFALAFALSESREQAKYATQDPRIVSGYQHPRGYRLSPRKTT